MFVSTLSDIIITDYYIVTDTIVHGHNYSRSTVSLKFFAFRTVNTNFRLIIKELWELSKELSKDLSKEDKQ